MISIRLSFLQITIPDFKCCFNVGPASWMLPTIKTMLDTHVVNADKRIIKFA